MTAGTFGPSLRPGCGARETKMGTGQAPEAVTARRRVASE